MLDMVLESHVHFQSLYSVIFEVKIHGLVHSSNINPWNGDFSFEQKWLQQEQGVWKGTHGGH